MSFSVVKTWDNRKTCNKKECINQRTWTRRIQWLSSDGVVKLKLEDGVQYREVIPSAGMAQVVWERFKQGQSIEDCISILATPVPTNLASRKV